MAQLGGDLKLLLQLGIGVLLLWNLAVGVRSLAGHVEQIRSWTQHPARITNSDDATLELEVATSLIEGVPGIVVSEHATAYEPENSRIRVPRDPRGWYTLRDDVTVLQDPDSPGDLRVLSWWGVVTPALTRLVVVVVLGAALYFLPTLHLGEDVTWSDGRWIETAATPQRPGAMADPSVEVRESRGSQHAVIFWCCLFGVFTLVLVVWTLRSGAPGAILITLGAVAMLSLASYSLVTTFSRAIVYDEVGLLDSNAFGARRVPWDAIAALDVVDLNAGARRLHYRQRVRRGSIPKIIEVYKLRDGAGRDMLTLNLDMVPGPAFRSLLSRIRDRIARTADPTAP